jgi:hypothetical protein
MAALSLTGPTRPREGTCSASARIPSRAGVPTSEPSFRRSITRVRRSAKLLRHPSARLRAARGRLGCPCRRSAVRPSARGPAGSHACPARSSRDLERATLFPDRSAQPLARAISPPRARPSKTSDRARLRTRRPGRARSPLDRVIHRMRSQSDRTNARALGYPLRSNEVPA